VARVLREHRDVLIERWMARIRLLTREKDADGLLAEDVLRGDGRELVDVLLVRLEGRSEEADMAAFYRLIFEARRHSMRLADVAYVLLELKSVCRQVIFESVEGELNAFHLSRLTDEAIDAVLRKGADLYELATQADHRKAQARLQEIFTAWEIEEALAETGTTSQVAAVTAAKLGALWDLAGYRVRFEPGQGGPPRDLTDAPDLPLPMLREQRQFLTDHEARTGAVLSALERVCRRGEACLFPDVRGHEGLVNASELLDAGVGSIACVPLILHEKPAGALLLYGRRKDIFRTRDLARLRDICSVLALALDRTARLELSRKEVGEAEVIARIGRSLLELPMRKGLLEGVVEALRTFRDYFDVSLFRIDEQAGECVLVAEAGRERRYRPAGYRQALAQGIIGLCARSGRTVRSADPATDSRRVIGFAEEYRARSELAVPVASGSKVLGVMHLLSEREDDFPEADLAALERVAPHIGVALQNASMMVQRRRDRQEIEQAHRQLANIIRSTAVGITSTRLDGVYTHWSPSCEEMLGYSEDEVVGRMTPADLAGEPYDLAALLEECRLAGRTVIERTMLRKGGTPVIVRETRVRMDDEDGQHVGFTSFLVDVTDEKRAQANLLRERDTLNLVVGAMGAGLALYDRSLRLQWANRTLMDWFGFGDEAFGKECREVGLCGVCRTDLCPVAEATACGRPQIQIHERTDAGGVWHCYQQVFTPVVHGDTRLVVLTLDITEQRRQTEQMRLINTLAEKVETSLDLEKVLHLVLTCMTAGHAIGLNRAFIFLIDGEHRRLSGRMAVGPVSPDDAHRIWSDLDQRGVDICDLLGVGTPSAGDLSLTSLVLGLHIPLSNANDTLVATLQSRATAHVGDAASDPDMDGRVVAALGLGEFVCVPLVAQDEPLGVMLADNKFTQAPIGQEQVELLEMFSRQASLAIANARAYERIRDQLHELQATRDRLVEAERMASVGRMASHLAHEIRNPLTAIGGFAASIARQHKDDPKTARNATIIYQEARRLERTLVNVLDYTRPLRPTKLPVRINDLVRDTIEQFRSAMGEEGVSLDVSLDERIGEIPADAEMVKQVIINLLKNALESMEGEDDSRLTVTTTLREGLVELVVSDTGCGIRLDSLDKLFSPFFTTKIGGVGLGLSVSRRIVAQHGGRIEVDSRPGVGSRFTVTLAAAPAGEHLAAGASSTERGSST